MTETTIASVRAWDGLVKSMVLEGMPYEIDQICMKGKCVSLIG